MKTLADIVFFIRQFETTKKTNDNYYVYLISGKDEIIYKIGISQNPEKRINELQTGNHSKLKLAYKFLVKDQKTAQLCEKSCHTILENQQANGEWFVLIPFKCCRICNNNSHIVFGTFEDNFCKLDFDSEKDYDGAIYKGDVLIRCKRYSGPELPDFCQDKEDDK